MLTELLLLNQDWRKDESMSPSAGHRSGPASSAGGTPAAAAGGTSPPADYSAWTPWLRRLLEDMGLFVTGYSFLLVLAILYFLGLYHVDLFHATYMFFFVIMFVSSNARTKYWRVLVWWAALVVQAVFVWRSLAPVLNPRLDALVQLTPPNSCWPSS